MSDFINFISGPLDKQSCLYFFACTMLFFIILVLAFFAEIFIVFKNFKNINRMHIINAILMLFNIFVAYFVNRLLYTMCTKSLA